MDRIAGEDGLPGKTTLYKWLRTNAAFADEYARAREIRADARSDRIDGYILSMIAGEIDANVARVAIDAEKWQAAHEMPKRYSDHQRIEADVDTTIKIVGGLPE